ncbi:hypothetical protein, partial [Klebsiella variicola]|uniref:hypothetical protein n=1 Tax=Klebsiella variicola TaxID=244366 RepID=UPI00273078F5
MNYGAGDAHDRMASQSGPATAAQRQALTTHGDRAADRLAEAGITDPVWLTAVRLHHDAGPGPLAPRSEGEML